MICRHFDYCRTVLTHRVLFPDHQATNGGLVFTHQPLIPQLRDAIEEHGFPKDEDEMTPLIERVFDTLTISEQRLAACIGLQRILAVDLANTRQRTRIEYDSQIDARVIANLEYAQGWVTLPKTGERIRFADLTVSQHEERIEYYRAAIHGYEELIDRHAKAIAMIEASGVATLTECLATPAKETRRSVASKEKALA